MQNSLLTGLNDKQQQAVALPSTHALILAGAGSGKTRVLVHRLGYLMSVLGCSPYEILAVTFTNKAANEMRARIESLFGLPTQGMWVGTFHGLAHRLLRLHFKEAGLPQAFQVIDSEDQYRLIKRIVKQQNIDDKRFPPRQLQSYINRQKEEGRRAQQVVTSGDYYEQVMLKVYQLYEAQCRQSGLVDFSELLLAVTELFQHNESLRQHYQSRFKHILVDEFQDTNTIQYRWLKLLLSGQNDMMVVGDDDQSIYGWRGAKIENIYRFEREYQPQVVRLEQNYRSTKTILTAANTVIANNSGRMGKDLWTDGDPGEMIKLYSAFNEIDEARYITGTIKHLHQQGAAFKEIAILYRSNAQSRILEEALIQQGLPYRIYGGMRFFERAEIKDALAYLRLVFNRQDDAAFERVINTPSRGIGERSLQTIRDYSAQMSCDLWHAAQALCAEKQLTARAVNAICSFLKLIDHLDEMTKDFVLHDQVERVIERSGLISHYEKEGREKAQARLENLSELVNAARQFEWVESEDSPTPLTAFLTHAVLEAGEQQAGSHDDAVQLMTLHAAKGLEFPTVFITGMEDELFPGSRALEKTDGIEEERRLCYVGMTRAMQRLFLTYAEFRRWYGESKPHCPSRFLREIPESCLERVRIKTQISRPVTAMNSTSISQNKRFTTSSQGVSAKGKMWSVGQAVRHPKFGDGVILNYEGQGDQARLHIQFQNVGSKWLVISYAPLEPVEG